MVDEDKRAKLIDAMHQAKAFRQPIVQQYLDAVEQRLFAQWRASPIGDDEAREVVYLQCLGLKEFREFIRKTIIDGEIAEAEINKKLEQELKLK